MKKKIRRAIKIIANVSEHLSCAVHCCKDCTHINSFELILLWDKGYYPPFSEEDPGRPLCWMVGPEGRVTHSLLS